MIFTALILNLGMTGCATPPGTDENIKKFNIDISIPTDKAPNSKIPVTVKITNKQGNIVDILGKLFISSNKGGQFTPFEVNDDQLICYYTLPEKDLYSLSSDVFDNDSVGNMITVTFAGEYAQLIL